MDLYAFYTGQEFEAYRFLGAHPGGPGWAVFRTYAPSALAVGLIGDFNGWQETPMERVLDGNFWEVWVEGAEPGMRYKYRITGPDGRSLDHCDPYGFGSELRPGTASVFWPLDGYYFEDGDWMAARGARFDGPMNIYEAHFGSWLRKPEEEGGGWYAYEELAGRLIPHLQENGFNFLELMPLTEHPCDASWGYQSTGFFCPTARYGAPDGLRYFIDCCHQGGIGVILDFAPVHFAVDDYALRDYDGTPLYEYPDSAAGGSEWGSCNFIHSRGEVRSFLQSAALYWLREFHADGLRMDAVSNLIYWQGDPARGENRDGFCFLQQMNRGLKYREPGAILIAEDSTAFPGVTRPAEEGGLGFDYKWDLGWTHDTLAYFQSGPEYRPDLGHLLTFSMEYYPNERYLLPLSHDEVVHGKATILQKMQGDYEGKFPQCRAFYLYMMGHPGKKLNFMGNEIGQFREWDENRQQDWNLLEYPLHDGFFQFIRTLNELYLNCPAFWAEDCWPGGFAWLEGMDPRRCLFGFERRGGGQRLVFLFNFSDQEQPFWLWVPGAKALWPLLSSDWQPFGGTEPVDQGPVGLEEGAVELSLSPFSGHCLAAEE